MTADDYLFGHIGGMNRLWHKTGNVKQCCHSSVSSYTFRQNREAGRTRVGRDWLKSLCRFACSLALVGPVVVAADASAQAVQQGQVITQWQTPAFAMPETLRPIGPNVFGTVALPIRARSTGTRWTKLMNASLEQPALYNMVEGARGLSAQQQAAYVQTAVNHSMRAGIDSHDCSDDGYWAAASETLTRGLGDCFDIAVAKMEALRLLGFESRNLYLTTGYFRQGEGRGRGSAALMVHYDGEFWLLPDHTDQLLVSGLSVPADQPAEPSPGFTPYFTYGVGMSWVHGTLARRSSIAG